MTNMGFGHASRQSDRTATAQVKRQSANAGEAAARILRELCPRPFGYTFDVMASQWTLRIECATDDGWRATMLAVDPAELAASLRDANTRRRLRTAWGRHVAGLRGNGWRVCAREAPD